MWHSFPFWLSNFIFFFLVLNNHSRSWWLALLFTIVKPCILSVPKVFLMQTMQGLSWGDSWHTSKQWWPHIRFCASLVADNRICVSLSTKMNAGMREETVVLPRNKFILKNGRVVLRKCTNCIWHPSQHENVQKKLPTKWVDDQLYLGILLHTYLTLCSTVFSSRKPSLSLNLEEVCFNYVNRIKLL